MVKVNHHINDTIDLNSTLHVNGKTQVQFFRLGILDSLIEFKHMVVLTNETQTILSFPRIFKFNVFKFNWEPNVLDLRNYT